MSSCHVAAFLLEEKLQNCHSKAFKNFFATELENGFENWNFLLTIPRKLDIRFFSRHFIELYTVLYILYVK